MNDIIVTVFQTEGEADAYYEHMDVDEFAMYGTKADKRIMFSVDASDAEKLRTIRDFLDEAEVGLCLSAIGKFAKKNTAYFEISKC